MSVLFLYLLKLSISLSIVWLFYQLILRRLTFYNSNRWYLVGYTLLSFIIPFINIAPVLHNENLSENGIVRMIPAVEKYTSPAQPEISSSLFTSFAEWNKWDWISFALLMGAGLFLLQFLIRFVSFFRMRRRAQLLSADGMKIYQVNESIIPFSFGNAVFINSELHTEDELREIIRHEFVHVKQRHTVDIMWSELICIINWYNPFAWMLKRSIRQNLEFIADNKVLQNGVDRRQYQYLLLKVIGNQHFSIAPKFNFSSLKKRIIMMNKLKSARVHMIKFLFVLPLLAVLLLAFRGRWKEDKKTDTDRNVNLAGLVVDAATKKPLAGVTIFSKENNITTQTDDKGYYLLKIPYENKPLRFSLLVSKKGYMPMHQQENWGNFYEEHVRDLYSNSFEFFGLSEEGETNEGFSALTGRNIDVEDLDYDGAIKHFQKVLRNRQDYSDTIPDITEPNEKGYIINFKERNSVSTIVIKDKNGREVETVPEAKWMENKSHYENKYGEISPEPPAGANTSLKAFLQKNPDVKSIGWVFNNSNDNFVVEAQIFKKDGSVEKYNLSDEADRAKAEKKYGELPLPATPAAPPIPPTPPVALSPANLPEGIKTIDRNADKVEIWLKDGKKESFDLTIPEQKKAFQKKYGALTQPVLPAAPGVSPVAPKPVKVASTFEKDNLSSLAESYEITDSKAIMHLKDGTIEEYNLKNKESRGKFEKKFGKIINTQVNTQIAAGINVVGTVSASNAIATNTYVHDETAPITVISQAPGANIISSASPAIATGVAVQAYDDPAQAMSGEKEVLATITRKTTMEQLETLKKELKEKDIDLIIDDTKFENGKLVKIIGTMKSNKDQSKSSFSVTDFNRIVFARLRKDNRTYVMVYVTDTKTVI